MTMELPPLRECDEPSCDGIGNPCFLPDHRDPEPPDGHYCGEHAPKHGFCRGCGAFWGGVESFEFRHPGWCDNCHVEFDEPPDDPYDFY